MEEVPGERSVQNVSVVAPAGQIVALVQTQLQIVQDNKDSAHNRCFFLEFPLHVPGPSAVIHPSVLHLHSQTLHRGVLPQRQDHQQNTLLHGISTDRPRRTLLLDRQNHLQLLHSQDLRSLQGRTDDGHRFRTVFGSIL